MNQDLKVVNSFYYGESLSKLEITCIKSFLYHGYDYNLYVYDDKIPKYIPSEVSLKDASNLLSEDKIFFYESGFNEGSVSGFTNLFRFYLTKEIGGIWTDTDVCLTQSNLSFDNENIFILENMDKGKKSYVASCLFKAKKGNEIVEKAYNVCKKKDKKEVKHGETGPKLLTKIINSYDKVPKNLQIYKPSNYFPVGYEDAERLFYDEIKLPKTTKTVHFWNSVIEDKEIDKNGDFPEWSIFEKLKSKYLRS